RREDHHPHPVEPTIAHQLPGGLQAVGLRHPDVHQDDVRAKLCDEPERLDPVGGLPDDLDVVLAVEDGAEPGADQPLVVGQDDADHRDSSRGSRALTRSPPPGRSPTWRSPPTTRARSTIPRMPLPAGAGPPRPSSSISTVTSSRP